jgi:hypothetical protein
MKLLNLITFPLVFILLSCGGEKTKTEEKKEPYIDGLSFYKERKEDAAVFKKKYNDKEIALENVFIGNAFTKQGDKYVEIYTIDKSIIYEGKSVEQAKKIYQDVDGAIEKDYMYHSEYVEINQKLYPTVKICNAKLKDPEQFSDSKYKNRLKKSKEGYLEKKLEYTYSYNVFTNALACKIKGKFSVKYEDRYDGTVVILLLDNAEIKQLD